MTVSYTGEVPNGSSFGCFWKVLKIWRGSVYKLVWREALAFVCLYYMINFMYRFGLPEPQKRVFEKVRNYTSAYVDYMPSILSFLLGFYVNLVVSRWWTQYKLLPWPDNLAMIISYAIPNSKEEKGRLMRRNIMRYMVLAYVITLQRISLRVKRRFPTPQHLVDAGLMMESEKKIFDAMNAKSPMSKYWMPLVWSTNIINRARKDGFITSDQIIQSILSELKDIRTRLGGLIGFDTVCVPLVYTQVASIACYTFFIALLIGRQMIPAGEHTTKTRDDEKFPDLFFPLFTFLQFIFYLGWLKVAEVLINPFGEDDDDIELNWLIDRHIKTSYMIVDEMHEEYPELLKDQYWEEVVPKDLPYTVASEHYRRHEPKGSAENYKIKQADSMYANIIPTKRMREDDTYADYESVDTPMAERRKSSNWISRQVSRMGSVRSQSTAYSSGGLFNRNRLNSVYSSPESGLPPGMNHPPQGKPSLYDKFVNRKSLRNHRQLLKQNSKLTLNGINQSSAPKTSRPRIPTPDVSKEGYDKENRINLNFAAATNLNGNTPSSTASGVAVVAQNLSKQPLVYPTDDKFTSCHLLLSPIKESDCSSSNNTLQPGHPATAALAQACLPKNFQAAIPTTTSKHSFSFWFGFSFIFFS
ncbi:Best2 family protein [Megaselia abdita]